MLFLKPEKYKDSFDLAITRIFAFWVFFSFIFFPVFKLLWYMYSSGHDWGMLSGLAGGYAFIGFIVFDIVFSFILSQVYNYLMLSRHKYKKASKFVLIFLITEGAIAAGLILVFYIYSFVNFVNDNYIDKYSMLSNALRSNNYGRIEKMLDAKLDLEKIDWGTINDSNNIEIFKLFVKKGYTIDHGNSINMTALMYVVEGHYDKIPDIVLAKFLLDNKADPNRIGDGQTVLGHVLLFGRDSNSLDIVRLLLQYGADPNKIDSQSRSPLLYCANDHAVDILKLLIEKGANINYQNKDGTTALHSAVLNNQVYSAYELLSMGADPNLKDKENHAPINFCYNDDETGIIDILVKKGTNINNMDIDGDTALHSAVRNNQGQLVRKLLSMGADPNIRNKDGESPMKIARNNANTNKGIIYLLYNYHGKE